MSWLGFGSSSGDSSTGAGGQAAVEAVESALLESTKGRVLFSALVRNFELGDFLRELETNFDLSYSINWSELEQFGLFHQFI